MTVHVMGTMDVTLTSYVESTTVETLNRERLEAAVQNLLVLLLLVEWRDMENIGDSGRPGERRGEAGGDREVEC